MSEINLEELKQKIKTLKLPECSQGDLHDQTNQICVDTRCEESKVFQALCSGCVEDKTHSQQNNHVQRQLKRVILEIANQASIDQQITQNLGQIEQNLGEMASEFENIGNICLDISKHFKESIENLKEKSKEESVVKNKIFEQLNDFVGQENDESQLQTKLQELKEHIKITGDNIFINNDQFKKEWSTTANEQIIKISSAQSLVNKIKNSKIQSFLEDRAWEINKVGKNNTNNNNNENVQQSQIESQEKQSQQEGNKTPQRASTSIKDLLMSAQQANSEEQMQQGGLSQIEEIKHRPFLFSELLKSPTIQITNGKIAKQLEGCYKEQRVAFIEPSLPTNRKSFFAFQVIQQTGWMGIGLALKNQVIKNNYSFSNEDIDHGQFLISSNGYKWVHQSEEECGAQITFGFSQYDILLGEYDPNLRRLRLKKKGSDKMAVIQLQKSYFGDSCENSEDEELVLCVNICEKNDAIGLFVESDNNSK